VQVSQSTPFSTTVQNDSGNKGVTWTLSGSGCSAASCGTLTSITLTSVTYNAPASVPAPATVTLRATSVADATKSSAATVTITAAPSLPISVSVNPPSLSVQSSTTALLAASVLNDPANKGVTWALSGAGCAAAACGTLTAITATSVTYNAPAAVPAPATVSVRATSVADNTKSFSSIVTITAAPQPISVSVTPPSSSIQVSQSAPFSALVQNDPANKGVAWTLSGSGCAAATCGTLTNISLTSVTYTAPANVPTLATVSLVATSIADSTKSSSSVITVTAAPLPISVSINPTATSVQVSNSTPLTASVLNDPANRGVTWTLSGTGCVAASCGTLTAATTTSVTYTAPTAVPTPAAVSVRATSIADSTKSFSATITITAPPPIISVTVNPLLASVAISQSATFTAAVQNDPANKGVNWTLTGVGCLLSACGTLTNVTTSSVTFNAPATIPIPATVVLTSISVADVTKISIATITVTATAPPVSVSISPSANSVQVSQSIPFTALVQNDPANKGVTWSLSGTGCTGAACGTLTGVAALAVTYNAPAAEPSPNTVTLTAKSVADTTKTSTAIITINTPPPTAPGNLVATANGSSEIDLSWTASTAAAGLANYLVERCTGSGCTNFAQIAAPASTTFSDTGLAASTTFQYRVRAIDTAGTVSAFSNTATAATTAVVTGTGATPTLIWSKSAANTTSLPVSDYKSSLPTNGTLPGNVLIATFQYAVGASASVTDDKGDTLTLLKSVSNGNQTLSTYCVLPTAGTRALAIAFGGAQPAFVSMVNASEWFNLTCTLDGSSAASGNSATLSAGSIPTTTDGDLIYQAAEEDGAAGSESWTQGASPWAFLSATRGIAFANIPQAAQYQVQATHGAINPTMSMNSADSWTSVAVALKSASSGTPPAPGIRIVHLQEESIPPANFGPMNLQFPSTGNLLITASIDGPGFDVAGISDSNGNTHTQIGTQFSNAASGDVQTFFAANANTSTSLAISFNMVGNPTGGSTFFLLDVTGASTSPFDSVAGRQTASGLQLASGNISGLSITPSTANGLVITQIAVTTNSINGVSPGNFLATVPNPLGQTNPTDENNGWGFEYLTTSATRHYIWTTQGGGVDNWAATAIAFKAAP
jgi:hypothetical protein